jgi:hypothetical protein
VAEHLASCGGCREYLDHIRRAIDTLHRLPTDKLPAVVRERLLLAFRHESATQ